VVLVLKPPLKTAARGHTSWAGLGGRVAGGCRAALHRGKMPHRAVDDDGHAGGRHGAGDFSKRCRFEAQGLTAARKLHPRQRSLRTEARSPNPRSRLARPRRQLTRRQPPHQPKPRQTSKPPHDRADPTTTTGSRPRDRHRIRFGRSRDGRSTTTRPTCVIGISAQEGLKPRHPALDLATFNADGFRCTAESQRPEVRSRYSISCSEREARALGPGRHAGRSPR